MEDHLLGCCSERVNRLKRVAVRMNNRLTVRIFGRVVANESPGVQRSADRHLLMPHLNQLPPYLRTNQQNTEQNSIA